MGSGSLTALPVIETQVLWQCCRLSRIRIFFHPGSLIRIFSKYFNPKNCFVSSRKYGPGCSTPIRSLISKPSRIQGQKGTGSGSATLLATSVRIRMSLGLKDPDPSIKKVKNKINRDLYCFVTSQWHFMFVFVDEWNKQTNFLLDPDPPTKMSRIRNTGSSSYPEVGTRIRYLSEINARYIICR